VIGTAVSGDVPSAENPAPRNDDGEGWRGSRSNHRADPAASGESDIIIDGGNSLYTDSERRAKNLAEHGILFIGTGVSGGEEGGSAWSLDHAGGNPEAWPHVKEILRSIAAKALDGSPCATGSARVVPVTT